MIYPDTSFLIPIYTPEPQSARALRFLDSLPDALIFTPFHRLEFRTGLRVRVFRQSLTQRDLQTALKQNEDHLVEGLLQHTPLMWSDVLREAERLGAAHLTQTGARSGDLLHVASAVILGAREFLTFDERQAKLARLAGLKVKI